MTRRLLRPRAPGSLLGLALLLLALLQLGGCAALEVVSREPPRLFNLTPKSTYDESLPQTDNTRLTVEVPTATAGLNTARIPLRPTPTTLDYYAGAEWIDVIPVMVQNLLIESFDNSDAIDVLGREAFGLRADYALLTNLREFQAEYPAGPEGRPQVRVRLQARLVQLPRRVQVAATSEEAVVPAANASVDAIVTAFDQAFGRVAGRIVEWAVREIASQPPAANAS